MSPQEYSAAVIAERTAFSRLTYLLRVHGAKDSRLRQIDGAFATWRELAALIDEAAQRGSAERPGQGASEEAS